MHIEVTNSLDPDFFIFALCRFMARRGTVRSIWSDNGTNFVGARNEFQRAFREMKHDKIKSFLQENGTDWILWYNNPPGASYGRGLGAPNSICKNYYERIVEDPQSLFE